MAPGAIRVVSEPPANFGAAGVDDMLANLDGEEIVVHVSGCGGILEQTTEMREEERSLRGHRWV